MYVRHLDQFLTPAIWRRWVRMNDLHCPRSFVQSISPLIVSTSDAIVFNYKIIVYYPEQSWYAFVFFPSNLPSNSVVHWEEFGQLSFIPVTLSIIVGNVGQ